MRCTGHAGLLLLALAAAAPARGGEAWRLVGVEAAPAPGALPPHEALRSGVEASVRMQAAADVVVRGGPWRHRVCTQPEEARERLLDGLAEAAAEVPPPPAVQPDVRELYAFLLRGCPERAPDPEHAAWLARAAEAAEPGPARAVLYDALAAVHPLGAPDLFEDARAPDDAVVDYHARREGDAARMHSPRLAAIVARRLAAGDRRGLQWAARAYAKLDDPQVPATFRELLGRASDPTLRTALWEALRDAPRPEGRALFARECAAWLEEAKASWRAQGAPLRGSPTRFGSPCAREPMARLRDGRAPPAAERPARACPFVGMDAPWPAARPGVCVDLVGHRATQLQADADLVRRLARWLRPHLDGAAFAERWPAVDAVGLDHGPARPTRPVFVHGDAVDVRVPLRPDGRPDAARAEALARALEGALGAERLLDAHLDGTRWRFAFPPCGDAWCADLAVGVANRLLEARDAPLRLRRDPGEGRLRLRVVRGEG